MRKLTLTTCRKLCGLSIIILLIYTLRDSYSADNQEMRAPNPNERVILNTADSDAELSIIKENIHKDILTSTLEEVKSLPDITPHKCRETKALHRGIKTTICVKDPRVDQFVSGGILSSGAWEPGIVTMVMRALDTHPGAALLDIGANIGMYTVMAAAMDKKVVAVDPILNNLALINQSLQRSKKAQYVSFIRNPISDKVEVLYPVTNNTANQGGTRLIPASLLTPALMAAVSGDPVVSTTLADLVTFARADTVIMKLDIEGFECKVLRPYLTSESTSDTFIPYIFMEWMHVRVNLDNNCPDLGGLVALFESSGYYPMDPSSKRTLDVKDYLKWKGMDDIVWVHKNAQKL